MRRPGGNAGSLILGTLSLYRVSSLRIKLARQPQCRTPAKCARQSPSPGCGQRAVDRVAQDFRTKGVTNHQTRFLWQKVGWECRIYRPEKPVAPGHIPVPLAVRHIVAAARFAFDDPDLAFRTDRNHIDPQTPFRTEFGKGRKIEADQKAADASGQQETRSNP